MKQFTLSLAVCLGLHLTSVAQTTGTNSGFAGRTVITNIASPFTGSTIGATNETGSPQLGQGSTNGLAWWSWTPTQTGRFGINTAGSAIPTVLGVFTGTNLTNLTLVSSGVNFGTSSNRVAFFNTTSNTAYQVAIGGQQGAAGALNFNIFGPVTPPINDVFTNALVLLGTNVSVTATNFGATTESGEPSIGGAAGGSSVWFTWTAPATMATTIDLAGSNFDTLLGVFTGTNVNNLRLIASNDNAGTGTNTSRVSFVATTNTTYEIAVSGKNGAVGSIQLTLSGSTNQPITFTTQPQNQTVSPSGTLLLSGQVSGLAPLTYQWQLNGTNVANATNALFLARNITNAQAGTYTLVVSNALGSATSTGAVVTVQPDVTPPTLLSARTFGLSNQVVLTFSKPVAASSITNLSHFSFNNGISVIGATQDVVNPNIVVLTNTAFTAGVTNYSLTLTNITDVSGNNIGTNGQAKLNQEITPLADLGAQVNGFQDDFESTTRNPNWVPVGPGGDQYFQTNGVLLVTVNQGDPNHLLYEAPGYDPEFQDILARIRVLQFGTGDPSRGGIATAVDPTTSQGIDYHFRNEGTLGIHTGFLDDARAWGPEFNFKWTTNTWYWMRLHHEPNTASGRPDAYAKVWPADGSSEPINWQTWDYVPARTARSGFAGIVGSSSGGLSEFEVDYVLIRALGLPSTTVSPRAIGQPTTNQTSGFVLTSLQYSTNRGFVFNVAGQTNQNVQVQATTNFTNWLTLTNLSFTGGTGTNGTIQVVDPSATNTKYRFYRISPGTNQVTTP